MPGAKRLRIKYIIQYLFEETTVDCKPVSEWRDTRRSEPTQNLGVARACHYLEIHPEVKVRVVERVTKERIVFDSESGLNVERGDL